MTRTRLILQVLTAGWAAAWAAGLVLLGLAASTRAPIAGAWWLGPAGAAAGLFVFMVLVADRCFPSADRRLTGLLEAAAFVVFVVSVGSLVAARWSGGMV